MMTDDTHSGVRAIGHIPAEILVHIPGGGNINLGHAGLNLRIILVMSTWTIIVCQDSRH